MTVKEIQNVRVRGVDTIKYHNEKESLMKSKIAKTMYQKNKCLDIFQYASVDGRKM